MWIFFSMFNDFSTSIKSYLITALFVCVCVCFKKKPTTKQTTKQQKTKPQNTFFTGWRRLSTDLEVRGKTIPPFWRWYHCHNLGKITVRKKQNVGSLDHMCTVLKSVYFSVCVVFRGSWNVSFFRRIPFWNPLEMQKQWKMTTPPALWVTPFLFRVCKSWLLFMEKFPFINLSN